MKFGHFRLLGVALTLFVMHTAMPATPPSLALTPPAGTSGNFLFDKITDIYTTFISNPSAVAATDVTNLQTLLKTATTTNATLFDNTTALKVGTAPTITNPLLGLTISSTAPTSATQFGYLTAYLGSVTSYVGYPAQVTAYQTGQVTTFDTSIKGATTLAALSGALANLASAGNGSAAITTDLTTAFQTIIPTLKNMSDFTSVQTLYTNVTGSSLFSYTNGAADLATFKTTIGNLYNNNLNAQTFVNKLATATATGTPLGGATGQIAQINTLLGSVPTGVTLSTLQNRQPGS